MAKNSAVKVIRVPSFPRGRAKALAKKGMTIAARTAIEEKHRMGALLAAAGLGLAEKQGIALPTFPGFGAAATYGVAVMIAGRMMKSKMLDHAATGLLSVAIYQLASGGLHGLAGLGNGATEISGVAPTEEV
jgi:hypothetical protein